MYVEIENQVYRFIEVTCVDLIPQKSKFSPFLAMFSTDIL